MSRIGKLPIIVPKEVSINYNGIEMTVTGKYGTLQQKIPQHIIIEQNESLIYVVLKNDREMYKALHGLYRTIISNMITGVSEQFNLILILKGVGYRATVQEKKIVLSLGYSHSIEIEIPETLFVEVVQNTTIKLSSCDKELLGLFAAKLRSWRPPEPYKGKGILYKDEQILRKAGKSGK
jgi:large subunit ribosomal protein L6